MKIETLERILDTAITCIQEHTGIEDTDAAEGVSEAERLASLLELAKSQGMTDVRFQYSKGNRLSQGGACVSTEQIRSDTKSTHNCTQGTLMRKKNGRKVLSRGVPKLNVR